MLRHRLPIGWIGERVQFYQTIGSTNVEALGLAEAGAAHGTLVIADSQTAGKGRGKRKWTTIPGTAIAFSLVIRPERLESDRWMRLFGWGAISVVRALKNLGLGAETKWPNDVLMAGKKVAGILINSTWIGETIDYSVIGIGINVTPDSVPAEVDFPAISVVDLLGHSVSREELLISILGSLADLYEAINGSEFLDEWQSKLAYRNQRVVIEAPSGEIEGLLEGLSPKGELILSDDHGKELIVGYGELRLRPASRNVNKGTDEGLATK
jgi:BirA family biotin operon repressor/biotin-[acetyl-CoA-carboxylase] ligase